MRNNNLLSTSFLQSIRSCFIIFLFLFPGNELFSQGKLMTVKEQLEDFSIFKGGLQEGHAGLYYFISKNIFNKKCDSVQQSFRQGEPVEQFYLKLRYLVTLLNHGHTRLSLPGNNYSNHKMAVLDTGRLYLPFEILINDGKLLIKEDCSDEQFFPAYTAVESIDGIPTKQLIQKMIAHVPADGINQSFKLYTLYNYFYFHHFFNLFYPHKSEVTIKVARGTGHYRVRLQTPQHINAVYFQKNGSNIGTYEKQLVYNTRISDQTAYLKVGSFFKGFIESFGQNYSEFLDSVFADIAAQHQKNLILDLRNNEGGGDSYDYKLLSCLIDEPQTPDTVAVAGRKFDFVRYAINLSDDFRAYLEDPGSFLKNDSSLQLKDEYSGQTIFPVSSNVFNGNLLVLINGGTFSASTNVIKRLYKFRERSLAKIVFIGEENGGDVFSNIECAGQSYSLKLPHSSIIIDMPLLCSGILKKTYPVKKLPDYKITPDLSELRAGTDRVLEFAIKLSQTEH